MTLCVHNLPSIGEPQDGDNFPHTDILVFPFLVGRKDNLVPYATMYGLNGVSLDSHHVANMA